MPIVDIIIIVLLLIGAIVGVVKGFVNSIFGFIATLVAMVGAYFLAKPFINFLQSFWEMCIRDRFRRVQRLPAPR